jgi:capsular polysaccharide biosynthesis protein
MNTQSKKIFKMVFSRVWILLLLAAVAACSAIFFNNEVFEEKYESRMKVILSTEDLAGAEISTYDLLRSSQMVVADICEIITSKTVLLLMEDECSINHKYIRESIEIDAIPNTRILDIGIATYSPELSLQLMQSLHKNLGKTLADINSSVTYKVLSEPDMDDRPVNGGYRVLIVLSCVLGGLVLGGLINIILSDKNMGMDGTESLSEIFRGTKIFPVPMFKPARQ